MTERDTSLVSLLNRTQKLHWDTPPETVADLLADDWRKMTPALRELLGVYETLVRRHTRHSPECLSKSPSVCSCGFAADVDRLARVEREIARGV